MLSCYTNVMSMDFPIKNDWKICSSQMTTHIDNVGKPILFVLGLGRFALGLGFFNPHLSPT